MLLNTKHPCTGYTPDISPLEGQSKYIRCHTDKGSTYGMKDQAGQAETDKSVFKFELCNVL